MVGGGTFAIPVMIGPAWIQHPGQWTQPGACRLLVQHPGQRLHPYKPHQVRRSHLWAPHVSNHPAGLQKVWGRQSEESSTAPARVCCVSLQPQVPADATRATAKSGHHPPHTVTKACSYPDAAHPSACQLNPLSSASFIKAIWKFNKTFASI